jgi:predicted O-linked N-acetylglucosamine transferase (SPINDLY family)
MSDRDESTLSAALAHEQAGRFRDAVALYDRHLALHPRNTVALYRSGHALLASGDAVGAVHRLRATIAVDANHAPAWADLGRALAALGNVQAAINAYAEAQRLAPGDAVVLADVAAAQSTLGRTADAEQTARAALAADARHADAWYQLAIALESQGRVLEALDAASRATALAPDAVANAGLKAQLEADAGESARAKATLESALARLPLASVLRFQLALLLERDGDIAGAARELENVVALDPDNGAALSELIVVRKRLCDWRDLAKLRAAFRQGVAEGRTFLSPFALLAEPSTRAEQLRCARTWVAATAPPVAVPAPPPPRDPGGKLRIAYLSADLHAHATAMLIAGVIERHDRSRFAVAAYSTGPNDRSPMRARLRAAFDRFVDARDWPAPELAAKIRADEIDVLVDLKGHTDGAATTVLALRPAPLQASWLGYPGTLGAPYVDYVIGDAVVTPLFEAPDYTEAIVQLPHAYQPNDDRGRVMSEPPSRAELGLPDDGVVFCCFNSPWKINPEVLDRWATILKRVPKGVLWLLADEGHPAIANLRREAQTRGVDPARLVFAARRPNPEYLGLYRRADLFVDTWPYGAHTTASDALWAGCPVVTWRGQTFASRVGASLCVAVGLPQLVCDDAAHYCDVAVALAGNPAERARLRAYLEGPGRTSPLFDTARFTRGLEDAFRRMVEQTRAGVRAPILGSDSIQN